MPDKVMELFRDLPKTNCGDCGKPGCLPFAAAAYLEGFPLSACPHLAPDRRAEMERQLAEERAKTQGGKKESVAQALEFLEGKLATLELAAAAQKAGAEYLPGPPEQARVELLGSPYRIARQGVTAEAGPEPTLWIKVLLLIYVTRADGSPVVGDWIALRDLPGIGSKARSFDECAEHIAEAFSGRKDELRARGRALGGEPLPASSADLALRLAALPRVPLQLLFWDEDPDFPARASILLDRNVLSYLDPEAIVFLAEVLAALLQGEGLDDLVP